MRVADIPLGVGLGPRRAWIVACRSSPLLAPSAQHPYRAHQLLPAPVLHQVAIGPGRHRLLRVLTAALSAAAIGQGPREIGYVGVFGLSILTNAVLFFPSGRDAVLVAGALVLNPLAVAFLTGIGGAIGETSGYALGAPRPGGWSDA
jgi:hypothetical protein